jgi:hypothetical protein
MGKNYVFRMTQAEPFLEMVSEGFTHVDQETADIWYERMEWHEPECGGRHGVLRNVPDELLDAAKEGIGYYLGHGGDFAKPNQDGTWDIEFVHMCKVFPPPDSPDGWCGTSMLFPKGGLT